MKKIFIPFLSIISIYSCKKNDKVDVPLTKEVKAYFDFKPGTYWIMKDSLSGNVDSLAVISREITKENKGNGINEVLTMHIIQYRDSMNNKDFTNIWLHAWNGYSVKLQFQRSQKTPWSCDYNFINQFTVDSCIGSLIAETQVYDSVFRIISSGVFIGGQIVHSGFYFSRTNGFVRMDLEHNPTIIWELERAKIIR